MKFFIKICTILLPLLFLAGAAPADDLSHFTLIIKNHKFTPVILELPADTKVELHVKNNDLTPEEFESTDLNREKIVTGGQEITVYVGPLKPGTYGFFGDFNRATARGNIVVK